MEIIDLVVLCRKRVMQLVAAEQNWSSTFPAAHLLPPDFDNPPPWISLFFALHSAPTPTVLAATYDTPTPLLTPSVIATTTYSNDSDAQDFETFADSKQTTASASWLVQHGISFGTSVTMTASFNIGAGASASTTLSMNFSTTESEEHSTSTTQTWSWNVTIEMPPRSMVHASVVVQEATYTSNFRAKVRYSGNVAFGGSILEGGMANGAQLPIYSEPLGKIFRDVPDSRITVIDDQTIELEVQGTFTGITGTNYDVHKTQISLPTHQPGASSLLSLSIPELKPVVAILKAPSLLPDGGIGAQPDGIFYEVVGTREETRLSPLCGFNDFGLPNNGIYRIETRNYHEYRNGNLVRTWMEDEDTFVRCDIS